MRLKNVLAILIIGGIGGVIAGNVVLPYLVKVNFLNTASILGKLVNQPQVITRVEEKTVYVPKSEYFTDAISAAKDSIVAVQSYKKDKLAGAGTGLVLTRDGLIAVSEFSVPAGADKVQIILNGQTMTASVVQHNKDLGVALIQATGANLQVARLDTAEPELARELVVISRQINLNRDQLLIAEALIVQLTGNQRSFKISAELNADFSGAALVNGDGSVAGIAVYLNGKTQIVASGIIYELLNNYLAAKNK